MSRGFRWTIGILVALLVMSCVIPAPLLVAFHLITGWASYLMRVVPNVHVNRGGVATALVCLAATVALGHGFARWLRRSTDPAKPWHARWTPAEQVDRLRVGRHCSYVYHGRGLTLPTPNDAPIACEPLLNHDGDGMNILFGDGHVEFFDPAGAEQVMQRLPTTRPAQQAAAG